jgi:hypothetical protein
MLRDLRFKRRHLLLHLAEFLLQFLELHGIDPALWFRRGRLGRSRHRRSGRGVTAMVPPPCLRHR